uniref:Uncharacterized protein n=1 Tax=Oryza meridionalis TaxID=40149 RepID=A0A0E0CNK6_9ORYZ
MGLTPTAVGSTLPSHTYSRSASQLSPRASTAPSPAVAPIRQLPMPHVSLFDCGPRTTVTPSRNSSSASSDSPSHRSRCPSLRCVPTSAAPAATRTRSARRRPSRMSSLSAASRRYATRRSPCTVPDPRSLTREKMCTVLANLSIRSFESRPDSQGICVPVAATAIIGVSRMARCGAPAPEVSTLCIDVMMPPSYAFPFRSGIVSGK